MFRWKFIMENKYFKKAVWVRISHVSLHFRKSRIRANILKTSRLNRIIQSKNDATENNMQTISNKK